MSKKFTFVILFLGFLSWQAGAWGRNGHELIARLAVKNLPPDMPLFFLEAQAQLEFLNPEPDSWRDRAERELHQALYRGHDPDHIFKFELFAPESLPLDRYSYTDALKSQGQQIPPVGMLPYRAMELFQRLRSTFRRWRVEEKAEVKRFLQARIIDDAGILGHYIADSAMPLHMSVNRNGWELPENPNSYTTEKTLHRRFESEFVNARISSPEIQPLVRPVKVADDVLAEIYAHMRRSYDNVIPLYELEKAEPFTSENQNPESHRFAVERLADAVSTLRDLWFTAFKTSVQVAEAPVPKE